MEPYRDSPPTFWFQPPLATNRRRAQPIDPVVLIILIPVLTLLFIFFFLPPFLSHTSHILKPGSVKSTWDSLSIFLVLFAILCAVMARKNDDVSSPGDIDSPVAESTNRVRNRFSDDFDVDMYYRNLSRQIERESGILNRSMPLSGGVHRLSRRSEEDLVDSSDVKDIGVDTFVVSQNSPEFREQPLSETAHPPPSAPPFNSKKHSFRSVGKNVKVDFPMNIEYDDQNKARSDPPPPPLPELRVHRLHHKHTSVERKVTDVATVRSSLHNERKRNKQKLRTISSNSETSPFSVYSVRSPEIEEPPQPLAPPRPPPPPTPPPRPPSSVFQNLFKKGVKHKRIHSVPDTPPPPPPPPPPPLRRSSIFNNIFKSGSKSKRFHPPSAAHSSSSSINSLFKNETKSSRFNYKNDASSPPPPPPPPLPPPMTPSRYTVSAKSEQLSKPKHRRSTSKRKPPLPTKLISYYEREDFPTSGSQSPLIPMPPPPPPFKIPAMKFELRGDFVKIRSTHSSVCSSPDHIAVDLSSTIMEGGDSIGLRSGLVSFPSPDVNDKADSFISRLKDEWRMEKMG